MKKELKNKQRVFKYKNFNVSINQIGGVGKFMIIEGENPAVRVIEKLGFKNPKIITESFDNIKP